MGKLRVTLISVVVKTLKGFRTGLSPTITYCFRPAIKRAEKLAVYSMEYCRICKGICRRTEQRKGRQQSEVSVWKTHQAAA